MKKLFLIFTLLFISFTLFYLGSKLIKIGNKESPRSKLVLHTDENMDISFLHPKSWEVESFIGADEAESGTWPEISIYGEDKFLADIMEFENPDKYSPKEWYEKNKNRYNQYFQVISESSIGNNRAYIIALPKTCKTAQMIELLIENGDKILNISYWELADRKSTDDLDLILKTIKFDNNYDEEENKIPNLYYPKPPSEIICD